MKKIGKIFFMMITIFILILMVIVIIYLLSPFLIVLGIISLFQKKKDLPKKEIDIKQMIFEGIKNQVLKPKNYVKKEIIIEKGIVKPSDYLDENGRWKNK